MITHAKKDKIKEAAVPNMPFCDKKKKRNNFFVPSLKYCQFGQDGWKNRLFFMKISWRWTSSLLFRKFSYCEKLWLFWIMLNTAFADFRLWVIMFTQERVPRPTFIYSKSRIETLKIKCEICSKLIIKTPGRLSTLFVVKSEHFHSFFLCSAVDLEPHPINL